MMLIYVADGESKTSHYSIATGFMAGMMLPEWQGFIQEYLGYGNFLFGCFYTIPGLISFVFDIPEDF
jgi:PAT family beta-lactamase induction signal transducer AmpG